MSERMASFWTSWKALAVSIALALFVVGLLVVAEQTADQNFSLTVNPHWMGPLMLAVIGAPLGGLAGALAALPLLWVRHWIFSPRLPFVRPGYLLVVAYGPLLIAAYQAIQGGVDLRFFLVLCIVYEVVAAIASAFYVLIGRETGAFPEVAFRADSPTKA